MRAVLFASFLLLPLPAWAEGFEPVKDKERFLDLVENRELRIGLYNLDPTRKGYGAAVSDHIESSGPVDPFPCAMGGSINADESRESGASRAGFGRDVGFVGKNKRTIGVFGA